jgi:hypothetical protein
MIELIFGDWEKCKKLSSYSEGVCQRGDSDKDLYFALCKDFDKGEKFFYLSFHGDREKCKIASKALLSIYNMRGTNFSTIEEGKLFVDEFIENLNKFIKLEAFE